MSPSGDASGEPLYPDPVERPARLAQTVADRLRDLILDGAIPPGTALRQERMAAQLGVSRTPLKHALQQLAGEGLLTVNQSGAATVVSLSRQHAEDLLEFRELIDGFAARKLATTGLSAEAMAEATQLADAMGHYVESGSRIGYLRSNGQFHSLLVLQTGNREAVRLLSAVRVSSQLPYLQDWSDKTGRLRDAVTEHHAVLAAIAQGDADRAERLAREHVRNAAGHWLPAHKPTVPGDLS
ncbi:MAG: GntR family transcriptional regulator [Streptosporangiaceae bacterium]